MSILDALQAKVNAVDSNTAMSEILQLMYNVKEHPYKNQYDSAGLMPLDSAFIGSMAYAENRNAMYMLVGVDSGWKLIDSDAATTAAGDIASGHNQGTQYGYALGGRVNPGTSNVIQKYSYTSDANATDVGDLTQAVYSRQAAVSSTTHAMNCGGYAPGATPAGWPHATNIDKIAYASDGNATETGDLNEKFGDGAAHQDDTHGYLSGGLAGPSLPTQAAGNTIQRFALASTSGDTGTDVGDLSKYMRYCSGWSGSDGYGYLANGSHTYAPTMPAPGYWEKIERFPFAATASSTEVGDTLDLYYQQFGNLQSTTHAYSAGGVKGSVPTSPSRNGIEKFPFAASTTQTDVGDLATYPGHSPTTGKGNSGSSVQGSSSTTHGYVHGGHGSPTPANVYNTIQKFSTSSDANATDVGDLTGVFYNLAGAQY